MRICYNRSSKLLLALSLVFSPLAAQEEEEEASAPTPAPVVEETSEEWQNWIFAIGAAVAAAIGITVVSLHNGHDSPQH